MITVFTCLKKKFRIIVFTILKVQKMHSEQIWWKYCPKITFFGPKWPKIGQNLPNIKLFRPTIKSWKWKIVLIDYLLIEKSFDYCLITLFTIFFSSWKNPQIVSYCFSYDLCNWSICICKSFFHKGFKIKAFSSYTMRSKCFKNKFRIPCAILFNKPSTF